MSAESSIPASNTLNEDNVRDSQTGPKQASRVANIAQQFYAQQKSAYIFLNHQWQVIEVSANLVDFGFAKLQVGLDARNEIDFLVGVDTTAWLDLPVVTSPSGAAVRVIVMPDDDLATIIIMDAAQEFKQQYQLQQKANENQLLLEVQAKLLAEIETARHQLEIKNEQLREASRLQSSFLSGVSHEFRTPLTSILGYTNLLLGDANRGCDSPALKRILAVERSSKYLLSLIENLLDHGKYDSNEFVFNPKPIRLNQIFRDIEMVIRPLAVSKNIQFSLALDIQDDTIVLLDDSRLRQCLINIIGNAIKFTDIGGVKVSASWQNDLVDIAVQDTGIGISEAHLTKIKQPFWQAPDTGKAGTGLGLTITERIIDMMGGSLSVDSILGSGSTVSFSVLAPGVVHGIDSALVATKISGPLRVLLAEDDEYIASLVALLLQERGVEVSLVENGQLAIDALSNDVERRFDMVLMDLHMPIVDGYQAVESIRASGNQIPIVVMTASSIESDRRRAEQLGCDGYLLKPVEINDLLALAEQLTLKAV